MKEIINDSLRKSKLVGILGVFPFSGVTAEKIEHGLEHLKKDGYNPLFLEDLEDIKTFDAADICLNWVISSSGLPTAQYLEKEKGIPYLVAFPVGMRNMRLWRVHLAKMLGYEDNIEIPSKRNTSDEIKRILIIGDLVLSAGLKSYLEDTMGFSKIIRAHYAPVASVKKWYDKIIERSKGHGLENEAGIVDLEGSVPICDFESLKKLTSEADIIIGDSIFKQVDSYDESKLWIELPDCISSCGLNSSEEYQLFGKKGAAWLNEKLAAYR